MLPRGRSVLVGLVALGCAAGRAHTMPASAPSRLLGQPAPAFRRYTLEGDRFDSADAAGRVLAIEFFADYCAPCQRRLPAAERLRRELPDVVILGVSVDQTAAAAAAQARRHGLRFPVVHDEDHGLARRFRVSGLPAAFVVGRDGRVVWAGGPGQPADDLRRAVRAACEAPAGGR